jgi:hypothetical protein
MDVVIPLGTGSTWSDNELRYSLRSLEVYHNVGNVYIIGHKPSWIQKVIHIPAHDVPGAEHKEYNILRKILTACKMPSLSQDFIFMNDDHFLLGPVPTPCYQQTLEETVLKRSSHDSYYFALDNTLRALIKADRPTNNFDVHCPIVYNKHDFIRMTETYDMTLHYGYVIKSLYCNTVGIEGELCIDMKLTQRLRCAQIDKMVEGRGWFSIGDGAVNSELGIFLNYLYPNKSKYEK